MSLLQLDANTDRRLADLAALNLAMEAGRD